MATLLDLIQKANEEFDRRVQERHDAGAEKYGPFKFLEKNTVEEAMQEVLDISNYARYTFIKLWLLNESLDQALGEEAVTASDGFFSGKPEIISVKDEEGK